MLPDNHNNNDNNEILGNLNPSQRAVVALKSTSEYLSSSLLEQTRLLADCLSRFPDKMPVYILQCIEYELRKPESEQRDDLICLLMNIHVCSLGGRIGSSVLGILHEGLHVTLREMGLQDAHP